ncbi:hypothetical protein [uncultured Campylobacter sp.]
MLPNCVLEGGERYFSTLRELYAASKIDRQSLKELWSEADDFLLS